MVGINAAVKAQLCARPMPPSSAAMSRAKVVLEQHAIPFAQAVIAGGSGRVVREVRGADQGLSPCRRCQGGRCTSSGGWGRRCCHRFPVPRLPLPLSMMAWRWRQTLETSSTPCVVRTSAVPPAPGAGWQWSPGSGNPTGSGRHSAALVGIGFRAPVGTARDRSMVKREAGWKRAAVEDLNQTWLG